jgi:hypothetical protein
VENEAGFRTYLDPELDLLLADYQQPQFDALQALKLVQEAGLNIAFGSRQRFPAGYSQDVDPRAQPCRPWSS